jgi:hypothetical protein
VWVRGAAIRPVPPHAVIDAAVLEAIERELAEDGDETRTELDKSFVRFEQTQPDLASYVARILSKPLDETALALGYFLSIAVWLAFERNFPGRVDRVTEDAITATKDALDLEEQLRAEHSSEPLDVEDVVAIEQPGVLGFVNEHVDAALEIGDGEAREVDVDDVHSVYRAVVVLTLALSHAVRPAAGGQRDRNPGGELLA